MQLFYNPALSGKTTQFKFEKEESRHIIKVLRKKKGDILNITNGNGYIFKAELLDANAAGCMARIINFEKRYHKRYELHLAVAPTKNIGRYEWFIEKATEIGVQQITPLICARSERNSLKSQRLEKVIEAAMKQSLRAYLPKLNPPISYDDFVSKERNGLCFIAHCEDDEKTDLKRRMGADQDVTILIGPEGDFTHEEIKYAYTRGFRAISLGDGRLRTETAAIVACTTVAVINSG